MRRALVGIVASCIGIVKVETETEPFVGVGGKDDVDVVLAVELVAAIVIGDVRDWRERIGEQKFVGLLHHV